MRVCEPYFTFIKNGKKFVEGRLKKGKWAEIQYDDQITIVEPNSQERITKFLKYKVTCNNFCELYFLYNDLFLPDIKNAKDVHSLCQA